mmetsp:Transcript_31531/g.79383  ORF Transcript_31531/g.79383 Transcript_31531/m.79383 type:complete len:182 (+) Transcript_31531:21-566(+)|eukprot:CAMPEP_0173422630 /NCGR_PEP_ID=MMETSP1357-20121228/3262_1 /TAXON_ID=77926 /ORGANISM="Hemiselmis rufescens, Strain PCC563" /LENGTH=181 /DNA_ID=CAMNT_0014385675 /DNA_START=13 /DNA_END=558 /DNA_ORIENTATION=+
MPPKSKKPKPKLSVEQQQELREAFELFDVDGSGVIDENELKLAFKQLGFEARKNDIQKMIKIADEDNDGALNYAEFCDMMAPMLRDKNTLPEANLGFDLIAGRAARNGVEGAVSDGNIRYEDLKQIAREMLAFNGEDLSEEDMKAMLEEADLGEGDEDEGGDGVVEREEFITVVRKAGLID